MLRCTNNAPPPSAGIRTGRWFSWMHYPGFTPDFIVMGKATGLAMVLANKESWACDKLPTRTVTTAQTERLLRCAYLMRAIFSDVTSPYNTIATDVQQYHTGIRDAIATCMAAEEARQQAWQHAAPGSQEQSLEVEPGVWARFRSAAEAAPRGDRVTAVWGGNMTWFSVAAPRGQNPRLGPANTALGFVVQAGLGHTSNYMRAIFGFRTSLNHLKSWLTSSVWVYTTKLGRKPRAPESRKRPR